MEVLATMTKEKCPSCSGKGKVYLRMANDLVTCPDCLGTGYIPTKKTVGADEHGTYVVGEADPNKVRADFRGIPTKKADTPMGVSQWAEYGKKYGYWSYFEATLSNPKVEEPNPDLPIIDIGGLTMRQVTAIRQLLRRSQSEYAIAKLEWVRDHSSGGGSWRRVLDQAIAQEREKLK